MSVQFSSVQWLRTLLGTGTPRARQKEVRTDLNKAVSVEWPFLYAD